jgi:hypothetical protein
LEIYVTQTMSSVSVETEIGGVSETVTSDAVATETCVVAATGCVVLATRNVDDDLATSTFYRATWMTFSHDAQMYCENATSCLIYDCL